MANKETYGEQQEKKRELFSKILTMSFLLLIVFLIAMLSSFDLFTKAGSIGTDSSVFRYISWEMKMGKIPYRDLFDHKGPLLFFINYVGTLIAKIRGVWVIEIAFIFATTVLIYKTARRTLGRTYSLFVTLLTLAPMNGYFDSGNYTEEYALLFQVAATYIFLDFFTAPPKYVRGPAKDSFLHWGNKWFNMGVFLCGLCFAGVFLLRANMIALWIVFCVAVFIYCVREKEYAALWRFFLSFLLGASVLILPTLIYFIANHAFGDFVYDYFIFNIRYSSDEGRANLISRTKAFMHFFNTIPTFLSLIIVAVKVKLEWKKEYFLAHLFDCSYFIYVLLTLMLIVMSGEQYKHYGMTLCPVYVYPFCIMCKALKQKACKRAKIDIAVVAYLTITFLAPNWTAIVQTAASDVYNGIHMKNKSWYDNEIVSYISEHTTADDEITVFGNKDIYYLYSERRSASKYSYQSPIGVIAPAIMEEYFEDLEAKQPKIIVWAALKDNKQMKDFLLKNDYTCVIEGDISAYQKE